MKFYSGITLLLLVALNRAAPPGEPAVIQIPQSMSPSPEFPIAVDYMPREDAQENAPANENDKDESSGTLQLSFDINEEHLPLLRNKNITNAIFRDLEEHIAEDIRRMEDSFLLFRRLLEGRPTTSRQPSLFFPWDIPEVPEKSENDSTNTGKDSSLSDHDQSLFGGFPFFGFNRPTFPSFPGLPDLEFPHPDEFPDNYDNKTHEVHSVNGTEVVVNKTVNKESGDGFNSFFHHQVIYIKPEGDKTNGTPEEDSEAATDVPEVIIPEEIDVRSNDDDGDDYDDDDEIIDVLPEVENEVNTNNLNLKSLPKSMHQVMGDDVHSQLDGNRLDEESESSQPLLSKGIQLRSLDDFNPIVFPADVTTGSKSSAYRMEAEDSSEVDFIDTRKAPDLSGDTRVNYVKHGKEGLTQVDPDAEVIDYELMRDTKFDVLSTI